MTEFIDSGDHQDMAMKKALAELGEHFSHVLVICSSDDDSGEDPIMLNYSGGLAAAVGMAVIAKQKLVEGELDEDKPSF